MYWLVQVLQDLSFCWPGLLQSPVGAVTLAAYMVFLDAPAGAATYEASSI